MQDQMDTDSPLLAPEMVQYVSSISDSTDPQVSATILEGETSALHHSNGSGKVEKKKRKTSLACVRCRKRHIKCPGGDPCKKCIQASQPCEYIEADRKIVMSMKYLNKLHDDISRLKIENASLRGNMKSNGNVGGNDKSNERSNHNSHNNNSNENNNNSHDNNNTNTTIPSFPSELSNDIFSNGRTLKNSQHLHHPNSLTFRSSPSYVSQPSLPTANKEPQNSSSTSTTAEPLNEIPIPFLDKYGKLINSRTGEKIYVGSSSMTLFGMEINNLIPKSNGSSPLEKEELTVLEREGDAYRIKLGQTKLSPGILVNFTLPSYSYASLLVDTFISYNDGCFYFFNEGLVKENLRRIYKGEKLFVTGDHSVTVETIWFCQLLLIFASGEMYLGTANKPNGNKISRSKKKPKPKLPGSEFFYQASELFTGLFSSGAITNCVMEGGIEVMLLYAFYLQVADCTIASYFYFGSAVRACLMLGLHVDAGKENLARHELEHRRRLFWTVFMFERMLASKAGLPLSLTDDYVSAELPDDFDMSDPPKGCEFYIFPELEYIKNCVRITTINASILSKLYSKQPNSNILPTVNDLVMKLLDWKNDLPSFLQCDFAKPHLEVSRLQVNMMTEFFQGMNLAVRPLLMHFTLQLKTSDTYVDLSSYSKKLLILLNSSLQASINTIRCLWALMPSNMIALFGYMDREYLFTSLATLMLFNRAFGVHEATYQHIDHALTIFTKMRNLGNNPALLRRAQLLKLLSLLDTNGTMAALVLKHNGDSSPVSVDAGGMSVLQTLGNVKQEASSMAPPHLPLQSLSLPQPHHQSSHQHLDVKDMVNHDLDLEFASPSLNAQDIPLTPEVFNQYLSSSNNEMEMELWNNISSQAMWLSGDVGEELNNLLSHSMM